MEALTHGLQGARDAAAHLADAFRQLPDRHQLKGEYQRLLEQAAQVLNEVEQVRAKSPQFCARTVGDLPPSCICQCTRAACCRCCRVRLLQEGTGRPNLPRGAQLNERLTQEPLSALQQQTRTNKHVKTNPRSGLADALLSTASCVWACCKTGWQPTVLPCYPP